MYPLLRYDVSASGAFPLQASLSGHDPNVVTLTVVVSNPSPDPDKYSVVLQGLIIQLPVGAAGADVTADADGINPVAPADWKLAATNYSQGFVQYVFDPLPGFVVGGAGLSFEFQRVEINEQPGTCEIVVMEGSNDCQPPDCPTVDLYLTKFPAGWGTISFALDPPVANYDDPVTLYWSGPAGATYNIEYYDWQQQTLVTIPAPGQLALASQGQYPAHNAPPLKLDQTTIFTLDVHYSDASASYRAQQQLTATIAPHLPSITMFQGELRTMNTSVVLILNWKTEFATTCRISGDPRTVNNSSETDEYQITPSLTIPLRGRYTLTAENEAGTATANLFVTWGREVASISIGKLIAGVAVSADNTHVMVAIDSTSQYSSALALYDPVTLKAIAQYKILYRPFAITVSPDNTRIYLANWEDANVLVLDAATYKPVGQLITQGVGQPRSVALTPDPESAIQRTYVVSGPLFYTGQVVMLDAATHLPVGSSTPIANVPNCVAAAPDRIYVTSTSSPSGSISVLDAATLQPIGAPIVVEEYPTGVALTPDFSCLFVAFQTLNAVLMLDTKTLQPVGAPIPVSGKTSAYVALSPDGMRLFVTCLESQTLSVCIPTGVTGGMGG